MTAHDGAKHVYEVRGFLKNKYRYVFITLNKVLHKKVRLNPF